MLSGSNNSRIVSPEAPAEFITERKEGLLQGTRIVPASDNPGSDNTQWKHIHLTFLVLLDPDSLWAFEYKYGEGSSPGIVPAGSMKVKWKAWKLWRHESHIHTDWCRCSKAKRTRSVTVLLQRVTGFESSEWMFLSPLCQGGNWNLKELSPSLRWSSESGTPVDSNPCLLNLRVWPAFPMGQLPFWKSSAYSVCRVLFQQVFHLLHILWSSC